MDLTGIDFLQLLGETPEVKTASAKPSQQPGEAFLTQFLGMLFADSEEVASKEVKGEDLPSLDIGTGGGSEGEVAETESPVHGEEEKGSSPSEGTELPAVSTGPPQPRRFESVSGAEAITVAKGDAGSVGEMASTRLFSREGWGIVPEVSIETSGNPQEVPSETSRSLQEVPRETTRSPAAGKFTQVQVVGLTSSSGLTSQAVEKAPAGMSLSGLESAKNPTKPVRPESTVADSSSQLVDQEGDIAARPTASTEKQNLNPSLKDGSGQSRSALAFVVDAPDEPAVGMRRRGQVVHEGKLNLEPSTSESQPRAERNLQREVFRQTSEGTPGPVPGEVRRASFAEGVAFRLPTTEESAKQGGSSQEKAVDSQREVKQRHQKSSAHVGEEAGGRRITGEYKLVPDAQELSLLKTETTSMISTERAVRGQENTLFGDLVSQADRPELPPDSLDRILDQIVKRISLDKLGDSFRLDVRLKPEFMGKLHIETVMQPDQSMRAVIQVEDPAVKALLDSRLPSLLRTFGEAGLHFETVHIETLLDGGDFGLRQDGSQQNAREGTPRGRGTSNEDSAAAEPLETAAAGDRGDGRIHWFI